MAQGVFQAYMNVKHNIKILEKRLFQYRTSGNKDKLKETEQLYKENLEVKKRIENTDAFKECVANMIKGMLNED